MIERATLAGADEYDLCRAEEAIGPKSGRNQVMVKPLSTARIWPVVFRDSSDAK